MNNDTSSTPKTVPVNELYRLILFWLRNKTGCKTYILDLLDDMKRLGVELPEGLYRAVMLGQNAIQILKKHLGEL